MNLTTIAKTISIAGKNHGGKLAIGAGIGIMFVASYSAANGGVKAHKLLEAAKSDHEKPMTKKEVVKTVWKCYIPTATLLVASTAFILIGVRGETRRYAALAAAYTLLEKSHIDLQDAINSVVSDDDKQAIKQKVAQKKTDEAESHGATDPKHVFKASDGAELFLDAMTGRLFTSSIDDIKAAMISTNYLILNGGSVCLNEFYYELGLDGVKLGDDIGWVADRGQLTAHFDGSITDDGRACIVFTPSELPRPLWMA